MTAREKLIAGNLRLVLSVILRFDCRGEKQLLAEKVRQDRLSMEEKEVAAEELDRRCLAVIRRHYGRERAKKVGKALWRTASRAAVAACLAMTLFAVAFTASEPVRSRRHRQLA